MGLSAPKNRTKLPDDPNNTTWSRNTTRFGHRILTAQGWTPGRTLGAIAAPHASHYTAASTSHVRVLLKDDTLGLGAKRGETAETFALGAFEGLLGRLNGKGREEVEREERKRGDRALRVFQAGRWGAVAFVSGGFLVGERTEKRVGKGAGEGGEVELVEEGGSEEGRKRKRGDEDEDAATTDSQQPRLKRKKDAAMTDSQQSRLKRKKRSADLKAAAAAAVAAGTADEEEEGSAKAKSKSKSKSKDKDKRKRKREAAEKEPSQLTFSDGKADKKRRKAEKRTLKEARKLKKAQRRAEKSGTVSSTTTTVAPSRQSTPSSSDDATEKSQKQETAMPARKPALSFAGGRHAVRQRYIRQKKMVSMDPQALREIFMVKA